MCHAPPGGAVLVSSEAAAIPTWVAASASRADGGVTARPTGGEALVIGHGTVLGTHKVQRRATSWAWQRSSVRGVTGRSRRSGVSAR